MAASLRRQMLAGYKRVLRARLVAFKEDTLMLEDSRKQLKIEVLKNKDVADPAKLARLIKGFAEVEEMLLVNIAQARLNERGNYAAKISNKKVIAQHGGSKVVMEVEPITEKHTALPTEVEVTPAPCSSQPSSAS